MAPEVGIRPDAMGFYRYLPLVTQFDLLEFVDAVGFFKAQMNVAATSVNRTAQISPGVMVNALYLFDDTWHSLQPPTCCRASFTSSIDYSCEHW